MTVALRELTFIEPVGLVAVAVIAEAAVAAGRAVHFTGPPDVGVASYVAWIQLDEQLDAMGIEHSLP